MRSAGRLGLGERVSGRESFDADAVGADAELMERRLDEVHERAGPADEDLTAGAGGTAGAAFRVAPDRVGLDESSGGVFAWDVKVMDDREPPGEALGQRFEFGGENGALAVAVGIQQAHWAVGRLQGRLQQREDRRDAASPRVRDQFAVAGPQAEVSGRAGGFERVSGGDRIGDPVRDDAAGHPLHRHLQLVVDLGGGRHRVRAQHLPAVDGQPEGDELPGLVGEGGFELRRHVEHDRDRVAGLGNDAADPQRMETVITSTAAPGLRPSP